MTSHSVPPSPEVPVITLDPHGTDHHAEAALLRESGPVVRVRLPGDVLAWSVTDHGLLNDLVADPRFSKDWHHWNAVLRGEISDDWPLIGMVKVTNMVTADGQEHRRLRRLVTETFTPAGCRNCGPASRRSCRTCWTRCPRRPARTAPSICVCTSPIRCPCRSSVNCSASRSTNGRACVN